MKILKTIVISVPVLTGLVVVVAIVWGLLCGKLSFGDILTMSAISVLITAVSVWAGLSIAGMIERKEFDELSDKLQRTEGMLNTLNKEYYQINETRLKEAASHLRAFRDEYFYAFLANEIDIDSKERTSTLLEDLLNSDRPFVERIVLIVKDMCAVTIYDAAHNKHVPVLNTSLTNIKIIEQMIKYQRGNREYITENINALLLYLMGTFYYYMASEGTRDDQIKHLKSAAEDIESCFTKLDKNIKHKKGMTSYFGNYIADCYRRIAWLQCEPSKETVGRAIKYTYLALTDNDDCLDNDRDICAWAKKCKSEMYLKNAGLLVGLLIKHGYKDFNIDNQLEIYMRAREMSSMPYKTTLIHYISALSNKIDGALKINYDNLNGKIDNNADVSEYMRGMRSLLDVLNTIYPGEVEYYNYRIVLLYYTILTKASSINQATEEIKRLEGQRVWFTASNSTGERWSEDKLKKILAALEQNALEEVHEPCWMGQLLRQLFKW